MGKLIKKIFLTLLFLVLLISTVALGVLFFLKNNEATDLTGKLNKSNSDLTAAQDQIKSLQTSAKLKLVDEGMMYSVEYPSSWTPKLNSKLQLSPETTTTITNFTLTFTKGSSSVTFSRIFGGIGDIAMGYPSSKYDVKVVNDKLIRVADKGSTSWSYREKIDCKDALDVEAGTEVCGSSSFFPGFGFGKVNGSAPFASAEVKDNALLDEVDQIVLSTL